MELQVETRNVELRKSWSEKIEVEKEKLIRHYANFILSLRVCIEGNPSYKEGGYEVKLVASVPHDTVVVSRRGEIARGLLTDAFDVLALQLKEIQRKKRDYVKPHHLGENADKTGIIRKLSPYESYGFIIDYQDREIYFHENALKDVAMDDLKEGDAVAFGEGAGDNGPQAIWVRLTK